MTASNSTPQNDPWARMGFEVELLAPKGLSRRSLADSLAQSTGGSVQRSFHADTEPSLVQGRPVFNHLTAAFDIVDGGGAALCRLVDDVTIQSDLDPKAPAEDGWYRILSDDRRLIRLIERHIDPNAQASEVLEPVAELFGATVEARSAGRFRLDNSDGATVAMVTPQMGERDRVCEIISTPLVGDIEQQLELLLQPARELGFTIPAEAAVHVHLDAQPFRSADRFASLVHGFGSDRAGLWSAVGTNDACRRLGPLPDELVEAVGDPSFGSRSWDDIEAWLKTLALTKYSDLNLMKLAQRSSDKDTVEIRVLPGSIDAGTILDGVAQLQSLVSC